MDRRWPLRWRKAHLVTHAAEPVAPRRYPRWLAPAALVFLAIAASISGIANQFAQDDFADHLEEPGGARSGARPALLCRAVLAQAVHTRPLSPAGPPLICAAVGRWRRRRADVPDRQLSALCGDLPGDVPGCTPDAASCSGLRRSRALRGASGPRRSGGDGGEPGRALGGAALLHRGVPLRDRPARRRAASHRHDAGHRCDVSRGVLLQGERAGPPGAAGGGRALPGADRVDSQGAGAGGAVPLPLPDDAGDSLPFGADLGAGRERPGHRDRRGAGAPGRVWPAAHHADGGAGMGPAAAVAGAPAGRLQPPGDPGPERLGHGGHPGGAAPGRGGHRRRGRAPPGPGDHLRPGLDGGGPLPGAQRPGADRESSSPSARCCFPASAR